MTVGVASRIRPRVFVKVVIRVIRAGRRFHFVGMTGNKSGGVAVNISSHYRLTVRGSKLYHKQFFNDSVDKEVVLLIAVADRLASRSISG